MLTLLLALDTALAAETVHLYFKPDVTNKQVTAAADFIDVATFTYQKKAGLVRCKGGTQVKCEVTWDGQPVGVKSASSATGITVTLANSSHLEVDLDWTAASPVRPNGVLVNNENITLR